MKNENKKSLLSVHLFVCKLLEVWAVAWLLPVQVSRFAFGSRGFLKPPFILGRQVSGLRFQKYHKFHREILFELNFVCNRPSIVCAFCLL